MVFALLVLALLAAVILASLSLFAWADPPPDHARSRVSTIDGLRGFLALAVVVHHNIIFSEVLRSGRWANVGGVAIWLGQAGVALFFMVTAYLFWSRLLRRTGSSDWLRFYVGRVFRIGPVYLVAAIAILILIAATTRQLNVPWPTLVIQVVRWLSLGIFLPTEINHVRGGLPLGVTWTLHYEWLFYLILPILSLLVRTRWLHLLTATIALSVPLVGATLFRFGDTHDYCIYAALFGGGMLTASLIDAGLVPSRRDRLTSAIVATLLVTMMATTDRAYAVKPVLGLTVIFYFVASGTTLFGAMTTRVAHRLGHISYGTYLLHATILIILFKMFASWVLLNAATELGVHTAVVVLSLLAALAVHHWVELPGIRWGDQVLSLLRGGMLHRLHGRPDTVEHR